MRYKADRVFGCWLAYFDRLPSGELKDGAVSAARKYPGEIDRIEWALKVIGVERRVAAFPSPT